MATIRKQSLAGERLAVLETAFAAHSAADAAGFARIEAALGRVEASVRSLDEKLGKQRGFVTGAAFVVSTLWAVVIAAAAYWPFSR